ncbi:MAG: hypothetical protein ISN64_00670 [Rickettsia sp.]|nr:hypothetical protein [Rickettsia sp.]
MNWEKKFFAIIFLFSIFLENKILATEFSKNFYIETLFVNNDSNSDLLKVKYELNNVIKELLYNDESEIDLWALESKQILLDSIMSEGYFDAEVNYKIDINLKKILYLVNIGERYKISNFTINGNKDLKIVDWDLDIVNKFLSLELLDLAEKKIFDIIDKEFSFLHIDISHITQLNSEDKTIDIEFQYMVSEPAYIEKIEFNGLEHLSSKFVLDIIGDYQNVEYHHFIIDQIIEKLNMSNLFSSIIPIIPQFVNLNKSVTLVFELKEKARKRVFSSANYNISNHQFNILLGYTFNNINFTGQNLDISTKIYNFKNLPIFYINYSIPILFPKEIKLFLNSMLGKTKYKNFSIGNNSISIGGTSNIKKTLNISTALKYNFFKEMDNNNDIKKISNNQKFFSYLELLLQSYCFRQKSVLEKILFETNVFINTNKLRNSFIKTYILMNFLQKIKNNSLRFTISYFNIFKNSDTQIPITEFLILGDMYSIRGYNNAINQDHITIDNLRKNHDNIYSVNLTLDLMKTITTNLDIGFFYNMSYIDKYYRLSISNFYHSIGTSLTYKKLSIPLKLEIAFPFNKRQGIDSFLNFHLGVAI